MIFRGYSPRAFGVKSNCEFVDMLGRNFPPQYNINVISCLPRLEIEVAAPRARTIKIFGDALFVGLMSHAVIGKSNDINGPHTLLQPTLSVAHSRMSSPIGTPRQSELTSSFRSSGHSSLNKTSLGIATGNTTWHFKNIMRFRYVDGLGYKAGYCRQIAMCFNLEMMPSMQVTNWDVLSAEV